MLFDSVEFLVFLPLIVGLYYLLPHRFRWVLLLIGSYVFYGSWKVEFLLLIMYSTCVDYLAAIRIEKAGEKVRKRFWLTLSLISNFGVLFIFKYFNFFIGSRGFFQEFAAQHPKVDWMAQVLEYGIPVGISFYTFQTVGYTIDVYRGKAKAERNIGKFALFVSYFPQLVAGPIERFTRLHHQLFEKHTYSYEKFSKGFRLILYGLFIKMVIADNIAPIIDPVFANPLLYDQGDNTLALLLFAIQIYADFHGYSLIAIGVAYLMGVKLMDNFRTPYFSTSIKEFWTRWHISLSGWFRDYLYIPLGGNQVSYLRWTVNIMIVFIVSGVWHGANFTFIVWGAIHGLVYLSEQMISRAGWIQVKSLGWRVGGFFKTFLVVNLAWLFFRSDTISAAYLSLSKIFGVTPSLERYENIRSLEHANTNDQIAASLQSTNIQLQQLNYDWFLIIPLLFFILLELFIRKGRFDDLLENTGFALRWITYGILIYFIMAMSGANFYQFIYFQF